MSTTPSLDRPERTPLIVDLDARLIEVGEVERHFRAPTPDEVLATYVSLLYAVRHAEPGAALSLRTTDLEVLSRTLELARPTVESRLTELMAEPASLAVSDHVRHRARAALAAGALALLALGSVVLVATRGDGPAPAPTPPPSSTVVVVTAPDSLPISSVPPGGVGLIDPQVVTRDQVEGTTATTPTTTPS